VPSIAIVLLAALALLTPGPAAASTRHDRWRRPLDRGAVIRTFSFDPATPYVGGRRRGIDLRDRPGAPVLAACSGTVTHVGRVPRWGPGVTLRCGALVATELGLGALAVRRGTAVPAGAPVGRLGAAGILRLGARRAGGRQAYVDPLTLLAGGGTGAPPVVAPPGMRGRRGGSRRPPASAARPLPVAVSDPAPVRLPWPIWGGLGLLAAGAGGGVSARRHRTRRPATGAALAHRYR
jgi:hypothetical protein